MLLPISVRLHCGFDRHGGHLRCGLLLGGVVGDYDTQKQVRSYVHQPWNTHRRAHILDVCLAWLSGLERRSLAGGLSMIYA